MFRETKCHLYFYHPQMKFQKGTVFTPVCQSFCSQGGHVCLSACWDTHPLGRHPLGRHPPGYTPPQQTPCPVHAGIHTPRRPVHAGIDMATAADGMHPTGMHSCYENVN